LYDPQVDRISRTLKELAFPKRFAVEVTAECNLACSMCHHPFMRRPKGRIPFELWTRCADQLAAISPEETECWFSFCGEPLLEPELLIRMIRYGRAAGIRKLNINTNGMLLTPDLAEPVLASGARVIVIGIDGFTAPTYSALRVLGDRDVVYENVEHLLRVRTEKQFDVEIQVQFIEMDSNLLERDRFIDYWLERGATIKVRNPLSWGGTFETCMNVPNEHRIACPWALTMMHVFWDGRVPRCPGDTEGEEGAGNAWDEPLPVLWKRLEPYRAKHLTRRFHELPDRCQKCQDWMTGAAKRIRSERQVRIETDTHDVLDD
jgi:sulfatase maturation enzyme AslB (radical SAM superfamily)